MMYRNSNIVDFDLAVKHRQAHGSRPSLASKVTALRAAVPSDVNIELLRLCEADLASADRNGSWSDRQSYHENLIIGDASDLVTLYSSVHGIRSAESTHSARYSRIIPYLLGKIPWFHTHSAIITALTNGFVVYLAADGGQKGAPSHPFVSSVVPGAGASVVLSAHAGVVTYENRDTQYKDSFSLNLYDAYLNLAAFGSDMNNRTEGHKGLDHSELLEQEDFASNDGRTVVTVAAIGNETRVQGYSTDGDWGDRSNSIIHKLLRLDVGMIMNESRFIEPKTEEFAERLGALKSFPIAFGQESVNVYRNNEIGGHDTKGKIPSGGQMYNRSLLTANSLRWKFA